MPPGRVALVTGASRGLGAAIARRLAAGGHPVAVNYSRSATAAQSVVEDIRVAGGTAHAVEGDVTEQAAVARLMAQVRTLLGPVGVLVLNATGPQPEVPADELDVKDLIQQLRYFVHSPALLLQAALPDLTSGHHPRVIHIGSDVVERAPWGNSAYVAAKSAQLGLARVAARELGPRGVTVNTVAPGWIPVERHLDAQPEMLRDYLNTVPAGRFGEPGDVAEIVAFLASPAAGFINGATIPVNGGAT